MAKARSGSRGPADRRGRARSAAGVLAIALTSVAASAVAQTFPQRPLRLIVGAAPGGGTDFVARVMSNDLSARIGSTIVVDNRGGAAGTFASELTARATPDGATFLLVSGNFATYPSLYKRLAFDPLKDLLPVSNTSATPLVVVVHPTLSAKSVSELIAYARGRSDPLNYAAPGVGSMGHLAAELFNRQAGVKMVHIAYKGGGPAITALLAGEVQIYFSTLPAALAQSRAGRLRALAVTAVKRSAALPELPTLAEAGLPGYEAAVWFGMFAPRGVSAATAAAMLTAISHVVSMDAVRKRLLAEGVEPIASTPQAFSEQLAREVAQWAEVIARAGIRPN